MLINSNLQNFSVANFTDCVLVAFKLKFSEQIQSFRKDLGTWLLQLCVSKIEQYKRISNQEKWIWTKQLCGINNSIPWWSRTDAWWMSIALSTSRPSRLVVLLKASMCYSCLDLVTLYFLLGSMYFIHSTKTLTRDF